MEYQRTHKNQYKNRVGRICYNLFLPVESTDDGEKSKCKKNVKNSNDLMWASRAARKKPIKIVLTMAKKATKNILKYVNVTQY